MLSYIGNRSGGGKEAYLVFLSAYIGHECQSLHKRAKENVKYQGSYLRVIHRFVDIHF